MPRVTVDGYAPFDVPAGTTLLTACEEHGVPMLASCGGFAGCNSCRVLVTSAPGGLSPQVPEEDAFLDLPGHRLGCQAQVLGDVRMQLDPGI